MQPEPRFKDKARSTRITGQKEIATGWSLVSELVLNGSEITVQVTEL
jgi:hypothetical protein